MWGISLGGTVKKNIIPYQVRFPMYIIWSWTGFDLGAQIRLCFNSCCRVILCLQQNCFQVSGWPIFLRPSGRTGVISENTANSEPLKHFQRFLFFYLYWKKPCRVRSKSKARSRICQRTFTSVPHWSGEQPIFIEAQIRTRLEKHPAEWCFHVVPTAFWSSTPRNNRSNLVYLHKKTTTNKQKTGKFKTSINPRKPFKGPASIGLDHCEAR